MNIIQTVETPNDILRFSDDGYRDIPPEEIQRRIEHMQEVAGRILARHRMETAG